jgi:hypothetical protein
VAHAEGKQRSDLDKETKQKILQHKEDVKMAEVKEFSFYTQEEYKNSLFSEKSFWTPAEGWRV